MSKSPPARLVGSAVIALTAALALAACGMNSGRAVLVAELGESRYPIKARVEFPAAEDGFKFGYDLRQGDKTCVLTGRPDERRGARFPDDCDGIKGSGRLTCTDGADARIAWIMTSCRSGYGWTIRRGGTSFRFGFSHNKDRALDQLERAQHEK